MKERWQAIKTWFLCYQWGCEPKDDGSWWMSRSGDIVLLEPQPCARCGKMMGAGDDGEA